MPAKNCLFQGALSFSALLLGFPTAYWAQVIPSEAPAAPHGFTESALQEPGHFNLSPNARQAANIISVEPLLKRLSSLAAVPGMSLEELSLHQQITEAVVVASLDLDSVVDDIDNERAQIVELQNIVLARRQRAIGTTNLATLALSTGLGNGKFPGVYREFNDGHLPYSQQWNLTIERQFTNDFYISTAYVANKGTHLISALVPLNALNPQLLSLGNRLFDEFKPGQTELNGVPIPYAGWVEQMRQCPPSVAQALQPYPQFCGNLYPLNENGGFSTYHSFQLKAEKRFSRGLWMLTSYTLSKFISSGTDQQVFALGNPSQVISPFERKRNKSLDVQDVPQTLSVALIYQLPMGKGHRLLGSASAGPISKLVSGWQINSIFRAQSGIPFWFRSSQCNIPGQFAMGCIPAILPGANPFLQRKGDFDPGKGPLFNSAAFEGGNDQGVFSFQGGHGPRVSNARGFPFRNHDFALEKTTTVVEKVKLQFRAEFFNLWNSHFFSRGTTWGEAQPFITDLGRPDFGGWTGQVTTPRNIQLAAKIIF